MHRNISHHRITFIRLVIPDLVKPALACPVVHTGCLKQGNPILKIRVPCLRPEHHVVQGFRREDVWISALVRMTASDMHKVGVKP